MLFKVQKSDGGFDGLFGGDVGHTNQILLHHIFLSKVLPIIDDCTKTYFFFLNTKYPPTPTAAKTTTTITMMIGSMFPPSLSVSSTDGTSVGATVSAGAVVAGAFVAEGFAVVVLANELSGYSRPFVGKTFFFFFPVELHFAPLSKIS